MTIHSVVLEKGSNSIKQNSPRNPSLRIRGKLKVFLNITFSHDSLRKIQKMVNYVLMKILLASLPVINHFHDPLNTIREYIYSFLFTF